MPSRPRRTTHRSAFNSATGSWNAFIKGRKITKTTSALVDGDFPTIISSIESRLLTFPDTTIVLPGHGVDTTIGAERATNPFLQ